MTAQEDSASSFLSRPYYKLRLSFRANAVSRGIHASSKFYLVVVHFPTWWIPPLRLRCGRNDRTRGRLYGFAYCFWNVSGCTAASSVRAAPCQLPRRGSFCTVVWGAGFYRERFRPFTCGTAHRPFPTVRLGMIPSAPVVSTMTNAALRPSQSRLCRASSPRGRAKGCLFDRFLRIRHETQKLSIVNCQFEHNCQLSTAPRRRFTRPGSVPVRLSGRRG